MSKQTSLKLTDEGQLLLEEASAIVARDDVDDPPMGDVIDAALTHLIESQEDLEDVRHEYPPEQIQDIANTSVLGLNYRTAIESRWR